MKWGLLGFTFLLVALGLVLRYGGSSTALEKNFFSGATNILDTLTLSKFQGNNP